MREELHRHLDGELPREGLTPELAAEAEAFERFAEDVRAAWPSSAPPELEERILRELRVTEAPSPVRAGEGVAAGAPTQTAEGPTAAGAEGAGRPGWRDFVDWWVRPRPVPVPPLVPLVAAAALLLVILLPGTGPFEPVPEGRVAGDGTDRAATATIEGPPAGARGAGAYAEPEIIYVQFLLRAPEAGSVALAGDFNDWSPDIVLQDEDGDGIWSARVPLRPGVHEYMFVVDGARWVTDPYAERYAEDGFGNRNAVLAIATPGA